MNYVSKTWIAIFFLMVGSFSSVYGASTRKKAVLKSLLLPGWGELSNGSKSGYFFLLSELSIWASRIHCLNESENSRKQAYRYAITNAGIKDNGDQDLWMEAISRYDHSSMQPGGYNEMVMGQAYELYPYDIVQQQQYIRENMYDDEHAWEWKSEANRAKFRQYLFDETDYQELAKTMTGVLVINRILSAINTARITKKTRLETNVSLRADNTPMFHFRYSF